MHIYSNICVYDTVYVCIYVRPGKGKSFVFFFREIQTAVDGIEYLKLGSD